MATTSATLPNKNIEFWIDLEKFAEIQIFVETDNIKSLLHLLGSASSLLSAAKMKRKPPLPRSESDPALDRLAEKQNQQRKKAKNKQATKTPPAAGKASQKKGNQTTATSSPYYQQRAQLPIFEGLPSPPQKKNSLKSIEYIQ